MKPSEMAKRLGVTTTTLRNWDKSGKLLAKRTVSNQRFYTETDYLKAINAKPKDNHVNVIYARVSTRNQKDDLEYQVEFLKQYANAKGIIISEVIADIGSGLNYKRKKWNFLLDDVMNHKIGTIYIAYPD
ncbi:IS607 family transposase, partial [Lactobacillus acetotolerans]|uniref:IS607 family transposase n=1 Tax=Lactobacillus acetotolerans TaxID=1600 RepID=UPI002FDAA941